MDFRMLAGVCLGYLAFSEKGKNITNTVVSGGYNAIKNIKDNVVDEIKRNQNKTSDNVEEIQTAKVKNEEVKQEEI